MAPKPSQDTLIHCEACGEDYSSTYRSCPFCGARNAPRRASGRSDPKSTNRYIPTPPPTRERRDSRDTLDDTYVFDGQDAFDEDLDEEDDDYYASRPKGGKRLAPKEGGGFELPPINWPRLITFLCSLVIIVAALIIVFTFIYPQLHNSRDPKPKDSTPPLSSSAEPSPNNVEPTPDVTDPVAPSEPIDPVNTEPVSTTPVGTPATIVNANGGLRLRAGPGTTYEIVGSLYNGNSITVLAPAENGWYNISYNGVKGYIMGDYISTISGGGTTTTPAPSTPAPATNPPVTITQTPQTPSSSGGPTVGRSGTIVGANGGLRVRSGPNTSSNIVASLLNGNTVNVVSDAGNGWYEITFSGSGGVAMRGYIMGQYISSN